MTTQANISARTWRTFRVAAVAIAVGLLSAIGAVGAPGARGALILGTLPGRVAGGSGSGVPVPVGNPGEPGTLPDPTKGCVKGDGYWKTHPEHWPVTSLTLGGATYSQTQLLAILNHSNAGDYAYKVAQSLISAMLNVANGMLSAEIDQVIADANVWLAANPPGSKPTKDPGYENLLTDFNIGMLGQTACDSNGVVVTFTYFCQVDHQTGHGACPEGYYSSRYIWDGKRWKEDKASVMCMTQAQCQPPIPGNLHNTLPCDPYVDATGLSLICAPRYGVRTQNVGASTETTCPINQVLRAPYPRALVNAETNFFLQPAIYNSESGYLTAPQSPDNLIDFIDADGNPTEAGYNAAVWKNFVLAVRSRRFNGGENWFAMAAARPGWNFSDRAWNNGPDPRTQEGATARYTYGTSSAGLATRNGRAYDLASRAPADAYTLPAYRVDIQTSCGHEWRGWADLAQRAWHKTGACSAGIPLPDPPGGWWHPEGTSGEGCPPGEFAPGYYTYFWATFSTSWAGINMLQTGRDTTYDLQNAAEGGGQVNNTLYWDANSGVWVPVVEVQSVLRQACVAAGTCAPPVAEPGSLAP